MKTVIIFVILFGSMVALIVYFEPPIRKWEVKVTYCDSRPVATFIVIDNFMPCNRDIDNINCGVPSWKGQMNVCNISSKQLNK